MIRRIALALWLVLLAHYAWADGATQRLVPGMSLSLQGELIDLNAPICSPAAGSYSVQYRNSIATGCSGRGSDDFATLVFTGGSAATYTMPQSSVTTFTGSISGTTLTTPSNAVVIGSVITDPGSGKVLDNTYVVSGSGTTWTINQSQTVSSETLTQSVFPAGHGTCFKDLGTAPLTLAATTSTIAGAPGVVSGNPSVSGGSFALFPGGEACLQANTSNNYDVLGFLPGSWFQSASNVAALQWTGLPNNGVGYPSLHLHCHGLLPTTDGDRLKLQLAYGGTFQATGYNYVGFYIDLTGATLTPLVFGNATAVDLAGNVHNAGDYSTSAWTDIDFQFLYGTGNGYQNSFSAKSGYVEQTDNSLGQVNIVSTGPNTTSAGVTGIQIYFASSNIQKGMCWLRPNP